MHRVLLLAYWYPPKQAIGSLRLAKWAKYLPDFDWEPVIVTVQAQSELYTRHGILKDEVKQGRVYRTRDRSLNEMFYSLRSPKKTQKEDTSFSSSPSSKFIFKLGYSVYKHILCFPDEVWPWLFDYSEIAAIAKKENIDIILSSSLPNTAHIIASRLARDMHLPWVADFRDLWTQNHVFRRIKPLYTLEQCLERRVLREASALITVSEPLRDNLIRLHNKPGYVIMNGFDPSDFDSISSFGDDRSAPLRILYTGRIYPKKQDPTPLFKALESLLKQGSLHAKDVKVVFYGPMVQIAKELVSSFPEVAPLIEIHNPVPYQESLRLQKEADVLLLLEWKDPSVKGVYTGKVFEYLGARRPILSIGYKKGILGDLLGKTQAGFHVENSKEIESLILRWLKEKRKYARPLWTGEEKELQQYTRREQTRQLANILNKVVV